MSLTDLTQAAPSGPAAAGVHEGVVTWRGVRAYAVIPAFSPAHEFGPLRGKTAGVAAGDAALVAFDESGDPWLIASEPAAPPAPFFGIQGGANDWDPGVAEQLGVGLSRVEFEIGTPVATMRAYIEDYARRGVKVLLLAGFYGRIPTSDEADSIELWAQAFAGQITAIEFGNETSYAYQGIPNEGAAYATRAKQACIAAGAVPVLVQADNANQSDGWVADMYSSVPDLHDHAAGWTVHPYGPYSSWTSRVDDLIAETAAQGAPSLPIHVTEWGIATDDGETLDTNHGWPVDMTYAQAAKAVRCEITAMRSRYGPRLAQFVYYNGRDGWDHGAYGGSEAYYGATTTTGASKGIVPYGGFTGGS